MELWRRVFDNPYYEVSNRGRVRRAVDGKSGIAKVGRILKQCTDSSGYKQVWLYDGENRKSYLVHRLVLNTFQPCPQPIMEVNHKNGVKSDNWLENLEWVTRSENQKHAHANGLKPNFRRGERHYNSVLKLGEVWLIKKLYQGGIGTGTIAKMFRVSTACIRNIGAEKNWKSVRV